MLISATFLVAVEVAHSLAHILFWGITSSKLQTIITKNKDYDLIFDKVDTNIIYFNLVERC